MRDDGCARRVFLLTSLRSLDRDPDAVTEIPGDWFGPDMLECGVGEAVKAGLLFVELELVAERIALHHRQIPRCVSILDAMQRNLMGEAEVAALAHALEMFVLRPDLEGLRQSTFPQQLHEAPSHLLGHAI